MLVIEPCFLLRRTDDTIHIVYVYIRSIVLYESALRGFLASTSANSTALRSLSAYPPSPEHVPGISNVKLFLAKKIVFLSIEQVDDTDCEELSSNWSVRSSFHNIRRIYCDVAQLMQC